MKKEIKKIAITGAAGQIAYHLVFRIAEGQLFDHETPVALHLIDLPEMVPQLQGLVMELEDCALPLLQGIKIGSNPYNLFEGIDAALLVGAKPRSAGMERSDLLLQNGKIFVEMGKALNQGAKKEAKILVVGNPCNTNALITMHNAPNLSRKNFHALMRLDQNRAASLLAKKAEVAVDQISNITIWGNHSTTQVPDYTCVKIQGKTLEEQIDKQWLQQDFIPAVQKRGAAVIQARGKSSAASAAYAIAQAFNALYTPTPQGEWFTSAVATDKNSYELDEDLLFGLPCTSQGGGEYKVVSGIQMDPFIAEKIRYTERELLQERDAVKDFLKKPLPVKNL